MNTISTNKVYQMKELKAQTATSEGECPYVYVRIMKGDEVGFSVLDEITDHPDFSNCGVFYVRQTDFMKHFVPCES